MESAKMEIGYVIEPLTRQEINMLRKMTIGYGNFKKTAIRLNMPIVTLRDVINKGYGEPGTIQKIRVGLSQE